MHDESCVVACAERGLGIVAGTLAGTSSFVFLEGLDIVTKRRCHDGWLLWLLPLGGFLLGLVYHRFGGESGQGTALVVGRVHEAHRWVPTRMAPLVLLGTWTTHLFGGSAGREGTALQLAASLSHTFGRVGKLVDRDRAVLLVAAIGGGFGAVFGVPFAGTVFAMEVPMLRRFHWRGSIAAGVASFVGHEIVVGLGHHHAVRSAVVLHLNLPLVLRFAVAGAAFGACAWLFSSALHQAKGAAVKWVPWPPLRPAIGGVLVVGLAQIAGRSYLGLPLPLINRALQGDRLVLGVAALKLLFTVVTLGSGFPGGEVTPLFVIGATLGAALAPALGADIAVLAAVGFVAVFAAAANTPVACTVMAVELFGPGVAVPVAVACVVATLCSGPGGIYPTQRRGPRYFTWGTSRGSSPARSQPRWRCEAWSMR